MTHPLIGLLSLLFYVFFLLLSHTPSYYWLFCLVSYSISKSIASSSSFFLSVTHFYSVTHFQIIRSYFYLESLFFVCLLLSDTTDSLECLRICCSTNSLGSLHICGTTMFWNAFMSVSLSSLLCLLSFRLLLESSLLLFGVPTFLSVTIPS